jgi:hypothetical protein
MMREINEEAINVFREMLEKSRDPILDDNVKFYDSKVQEL